MLTSTCTLRNGAQMLRGLFSLDASDTAIVLSPAVK